MCNSAGSAIDGSWMLLATGLAFNKQYAAAGVYLDPLDSLK